MKLLEQKKKNSKLKPFLIGSISLLSIVGISMAGYSYFEKKDQLISVSSVEKQAFLNKVAENMQEKYGEAFSESDVSSETATISQIPGISSSPKIITVQKETEPETTEAAKEVKEFYCLSRYRCRLYLLCFLKQCNFQFTGSTG